MRKKIFFLILLALLMLLFISITPLRAQETFLKMWLLYTEQPISKQPSIEVAKKFQQSFNLINPVNELIKIMPRAIQNYDKDKDDVPYLLRKKKEFEANNKNIMISVTILRWYDALDNIRNLFSGKGYSDAPDILEIGSTWMQEFISKKSLVALNPGVDSNIEGVFDPNLLNIYRDVHSNNLFALPWRIDIKVLYIWNKAYDNDSTKFTHLFDNNQQIITTNSFFSCLENIQIKIYKGETNTVLERPFVIPVHPLEWNMLHDYDLWLGIFDGNLLLEKKHIRHPWKSWWVSFHKTTQATDFLIKIAPYTDMQSEKIFAECDRDFIDEKYAMFISGPWTAVRLRKDKEKWKRITIIPPPIGTTGKKLSYLGSSGLAISRYAKERGVFNQAMQFLKHVTLDSSCSDLMFCSTDEPIFPSNNTAIQSFVNQDPKYMIFQELVPFSRAHPRWERWAEIMESDFTRNNLYHYWRCVGAGKSEEAKVTLSVAADRINSEIYWKPVNILFFSIFGSIALVFLVKTSERRIKLIYIWVKTKARQAEYIDIILYIKKQQHNKNNLNISLLKLHKPKNKLLYILQKKHLRLDKIIETVVQLENTSIIDNHMNYLTETISLPHDKLIDFGKKLADIALPDGEDNIREKFNKEVKNAFEQFKGIRLWLCIEPKELEYLPWEFLCLHKEEDKLPSSNANDYKENDYKEKMYDWMHRNFLVLNRDISLVRLSNIEEIKKLKKSKVVKLNKMLVAPANPKSNDWHDLPTMEDEISRIEATFDYLSKNQVKVNRIGNGSKNTTKESLEKELNDDKPPIVHFILHGYYKPDDSQEPKDSSIGSGIVLEKTVGSGHEYLKSDKLAEMLKSVFLTVLPVCDTAREDPGKAFSSIAKDLVKQDIPAVIAMRFKIPDIVGVPFSRSFYGAIVDHLILDKCVWAAREALFSILYFSTREYSNVPAWGFINFYANPKNINTWFYI